MIIHHPLRFVMALYLFYGWIYFLVLKAHCPVYFVYFTLFLFPAWILYEDFIYLREYYDVSAILFINIISLPVPFFVFYTLSLDKYFYLTLAYLVSYISLGVYFNAKMFR
ncbi:conserved lipothrixviral protein [Sulfolobus islandicus filamentous virus 2]|uniref:Conserved lipothrixviral protein n=1 Tax=Sulfolobus islandicus filamentous virus 2 TaxID=1902331 RepID=A0A1D8BJC4_SIFV|nr:conserved lipothrixviral protein [Sulfolobus islandicus filamentous virus 2]